MAKPDFKEGELVLVQKPVYERRLNAILPQCDGPLVVSRLPTAHTAILEDCMTAEKHQHGRPVAVSRLVRFRFPSEWATEGLDDREGVDAVLANLRTSDMVAVMPRVSYANRVHVARVE